VPAQANSDADNFVLVILGCFALSAGLGSAGWLWSQGTNWLVAHQVLVAAKQHAICAALRRRRRIGHPACSDRLGGRAGRRGSAGQRRSPRLAAPSAAGGRSMSDRSREVLACDAAARLRAASCRGQRDLWNTHERAYLEAERGDAAAEAAEGALLLCDQCPVLDRCAAWAAVDRYTGLAGGAGWINGRRRDVPRPAQIALAS
jgi:hypothetical protein